MLYKILYLSKFVLTFKNNNMKTIKTWSLVLGLLFLTSSATIAKEVKKNIKIKSQAEVNVDLAQFGKYLKDGNYM